MSTIIKHQMKFEVVTMTPTWAQELLNHNHPRNRKRLRIEAYERDMKQGYWRLTPEPGCATRFAWQPVAMSAVVTKFDVCRAS